MPVMSVGRGSRSSLGADKIPFWRGASREHRAILVDLVGAQLRDPQSTPIISDLSFPWANSPSVPTEEILSQMRTADPPVRYLVGTPKGRLSKLEKELLDKPWRQARLGVQVKLLPKDGELYVFAESRDRLAKERSMRRRQLKWLWKRLKELSAMTLSRQELLMKLGAA